MSRLLLKLLAIFLAAILTPTYGADLAQAYDSDKAPSLSYKNRQLMAYLISAPEPACQSCAGSQRKTPCAGGFLSTQPLGSRRDSRHSVLYKKSIEAEELIQASVKLFILYRALLI
ncbi:MAG: hypothetical protein K2X27_23620 [Candidatus Obscuribacterales bacterium]|nr:hypothetical protein [Candidatus Obscuribacterales bacterium]